MPILNVAGGGINLAQRVMDCGDGGHVLLSKAAAEILGQFSTWQAVIHDFGEHAVKHGVRIQVFNAFDAEFGNPQMPSKLHPRHQILSAAFPAPSRRSSIEKRNRVQMIRRVRHDWIDGVLHKSLWKVARLEPGLTVEPDVVESTLVLERPFTKCRVLPPETRISEVYDEQVGQLLILGAAGTGKTTALLELAQALLDRAQKDDDHPIPVILNLSSWPRQRAEPLTKWLVSELNYRYDVPWTMAEQWVTTESIIPLLDGLDEVPQVHRLACVRSINDFRREHGLLPLAVCSRYDDYRRIESRLRLPGSVILQPLTKQKVEEYLANPLPALESLRVAVRNDPGLYDLFDTPLMLAVGILGLGSSMTLMVPWQSTLEQRRARLFARYVDSMFARRKEISDLARERAMAYLSWLAFTLLRLSQTTFNLESLDQEWLLPTTGIWKFRSAFVLATGLACALGIGFIFAPILGAVGLLTGNTVPGRLYWVFVLLILPIIAGTLGALIGFVLGIVGGVAAILTHALEKYRPVDQIILSWQAMTKGLVQIMDGSIACGFAAVSCAIDRAFIPGELQVARPNDGTRRSLRSAARIALLQGSCVALLFFLATLVREALEALPNGRIHLAWLLLLPALGVSLGILFALEKGGGFWLRHWVVRMLLWRSSKAPMRLIRFLDSASDCLFLRKVGGGYIFAHRLLMEYFASLYESGSV